MALISFSLLAAASDSPSGPSVTAGSAILIDAGSGRVLWGKNMDTPRYPASTTKVMTALLLIEKCKPDDVIVAPPGVERVDPSSMHLRPGEKVTAREMLWAIMLRSANDGAVAIAHHISGSVAGFAALMNQRAKELGCTHTHFENPNGLNNPRHVVSARDLAIITREAMKHPEFREVVRETRHKIVRSMNQRDTVMVSKNKLIRKDKTIDGVKTGWTVPAGHCYVGSAFRNGFRLITVVLKSSSWQDDDEALVGWGYAHFTPVFLEGDKAPHATVPVSWGGLLEVGTRDPVYALVPKSGSKDIPVRFELTPEFKSTGTITKPVEVGQTVGEFVIGSGEDEYRVPAVAKTSAQMASRAGVLGSGGVRWTTLGVGALLAGGAFLMRRKSRNVRSGFGAS